MIQKNNFLEAFLDPTIPVKGYMQISENVITRNCRAWIMMNSRGVSRIPVIKYTAVNWQQSVGFSFLRIYTDWEIIVYSFRPHTSNIAGLSLIPYGPKTFFNVYFFHFFFSFLQVFITTVRFLFWFLYFFDTRIMFVFTFTYHKVFVFYIKCCSNL